MDRPIRRALAALGVLTLGFGAGAVFSSSAGAGGTVSLDPSSGPVGAEIAFSGENCTASPTAVGADFETTDSIRVYLQGQGNPTNPPVGYGTVDTTDPDRAFSGTFTVPDEWIVQGGGAAVPTAPEPGTYDLVFDCTTWVTGDASIVSSFTITGAGSTTTTAPVATTTTVAVSPPTSTDGGDFVPPAEPPADAEPFTTAAKGSSVPGGTLVIDEPGFVPGEAVPVVLYSDPVVLGTVTADAEGDVAGSFTIPTSTPPGPHRLVLFGADTVKVLSLTVAAPATPAPATPVSTISLTG